MKNPEEIKEKIDNAVEEVKANIAEAEQKMADEGELPNDEGTDQVVGGLARLLPE